MNTLGISTALLSALFMGTIGVFSKKTGLPAEVITFFRLGLGAAFMLLFLFGARKQHLLRQWPTWPVLLNGVMLAGFIIFYVQAMNYTTMANAIMMVYLAPLAASVYAHFGLKERLDWRSTLLIGLALLGFAMMMEFRIDTAGGAKPMLGLILGLLSMGCYAAFILINRIIDHRIHVYTRTFYQLLTGGLIMLPLFLINRPELPTWTWPWLLGTGLIPGFLAILCAVIALNLLPAATFGTLAYVEPLAVILFGWTLFGETLSVLQTGGCLIIIASSIIKTLLTRAKTSPVEGGL